MDVARSLRVHERNRPTVRKANIANFNSPHLWRIVRVVRCRRGTPPCIDMRKQMQNVVTTTPTENTALAVIGDDDPFAAYANAVAPRNIIGTLLKFSKGDYLAGEEGALVPIGTVLTANVAELLVGWVRWADSKPTDHIMLRVADGKAVPKRVELGDTDQDKWEVDSRGERRDPWQFTNYLPLMSENGELFTFTTSSRGGIGAIGDLCRRYSQHSKRHPDVLPMIALDVDSYQHKVKEYGRIKFPRFTPMGWGPKATFDAALAAAGFTVSEEGPTEPVPPNADEMSDTIPF
jgi:hypothetical protein